jgi:hypothetical protein
MAKNTKNTLADLNSFLKQKQVETSAAAPAAEVSKDEFINKSPSTLVEVTKLDDLKKEAQAKEQAIKNIEADIIEKIKVLANDKKISFRKALYRVIEHALQDNPAANASDVILMNMVHYLHHTENMAEGIDQYVEEMKKK